MVATTGRRVLVELRELLSMLRDPDAADGDGLLPDPESAMTEVVQRMRAAGLPIDVEIDGRLAQVSTLARVTVARVIGEALTNVLNHAGPGTPSLVRVVVTPPESLRAHIRNDKPARAVSGLPRSGHGLTGMRERVALLGDAEIAASLHLGVTTVKTHIVALLDKLSLRNRVQAGILAHRLGLVDDEFRPTGR
ncbi:MAG TPA: LuxR C-terminal-related transcriptional regulator [Candidatus Limnocylindrales bacterium]|nr:LuxR C-terminal-related transcriptional regulator [Candidatus Limnocylindrales bacterium]